VVCKVTAVFIEDLRPGFLNRGPGAPGPQRGQGAVIRGPRADAFAKQL